ncbi:MAG: tetratricopeptide repeat protein [Chitinophagaceae bacterium]|nr:tetratricopeptide repeat protein [Chitinophagaceae bacterium]
MKHTLLFFALLLFSHITFGQQKEEAEKLVNEGITSYDNGNYQEALAKYDKALDLDKDNLLAMSEKAMTLAVLKRYDEAIAYCKKSIELYPGENGLKLVYVTYGNAYDNLKQTEKALEIYDEGMKQFPNYYQLPFNKGIAYSGLKKYDEAILCFQKSATLSPNHPGSHNALARLLLLKEKRIPSILAYSRFFVLEQEGTRAKENLIGIQRLMKGDVEKTGKNSITINISSDMLADTVQNGKVKENSFTTTDLILAMDAAMDYDKKNKKKTAVQLFQRKFETICSSMKEVKKDNFGFYWEYYAPYFIEMKDKNLTETFSYIVFASSEDPDVVKWLKNHSVEIVTFYAWSKNYRWR